MQFLVGKDYPELCATCRGAIDSAAMLLEEGPDTDDEEAPCMLAYDMGWLCSSQGWSSCPSLTRRVDE